MPTASTSNHSGSRNKIILDETVNPKRPLRPGRGGNGTINSLNAAPCITQNSSPSVSNQSSRPMSHLSGGLNGSSGGGDTNPGDLMNSVSMQHILNTSLSTNSSRRLVNQDELLDDLNSTMNSVSLDMAPPPPKPPKSAVIKLKFNQSESIESSNGVDVGSSDGVEVSGSGSGSGSGGSSQSTDDLVKPLAAPIIDTSTHKSSNSLNSTSLQFRYLSGKTTSDSILNRVSHL